ncbi:hypothetical protein AAE02nite_47990 [Adhaeribacter aerolatus]|uniref:ADP-heptose--LPS heptosyltransferase n=1 Tax=Adhaeribacter aerolatus TaxID=670289 RepID=A0A512B579_9BACT|nr:glycosyltransferase family 9 protein [Adhaeribacter aerolatus]GEO07135.1 hypothetical protein AAE02nite_47990 [Adhaeribacter aerolatus]
MSQDKQEDTSDYWMRCMRSGAFEEAWHFSDKVLQSRAGQPCWHWPRHLQYIWDGSSFEGKRVLVRCYHGLGDTIQFIRYAPLLKAIAAKVIVWAQAPLIPILETAQGIDELLPLHDGTPEVEYDIDVEIMELPHIFRTTLNTIPLDIPYLQVPPQPLSSENGHLAVGLVWKPGDWNEQRAVPFPLLAPLANVPGIKLYILQANAQAAGWQNGFGINPGEFSLYEFARVVSSLDLIISVDSMPVHLAGALGVPVWTLLHAEADWRWMDNREDSPWYPTMRLFRQERAGDWESLILRVAGELEVLAQNSLHYLVKYSPE